MRYGKLDNTGRDVSRLCIGCMSFALPERGNHSWSLGEAESRPAYRPHAIAGFN